MSSLPNSKPNIKSRAARHATIVASTTVTKSLVKKEQEEALMERKIILATEGFTTNFCKSILKDKSKLSEHNALVVAEYIIAMKREINPRPSYIRYTFQFLSELSRSVGLEKHFKNMIQEDILYYLDSNRKSENEDPLHKWIGSYNTKRIVLFRFFKWLYYPTGTNPWQ